jgi:P-type Ca2+ transporter type 2C
MYDPPRKEAADAVLKCRLSGIKPIMITGDHRETASAIAKETGILQSGDIIMTGSELDRIDKNKFLRRVENTSVYARVSPRHKLDIVRALKKLGHIVAMTGDGVNDAPAVREADIGIAMGISGTDVTKEASAMILMDDNFSTIVAAVEEGRVIYNNIRKFIRYLLSCNIGEVLTMFVGMLIGLPVVLLPIQILWVNLVTDGLPAIALGLEPGEKDLMRGAGRNPKDSIFSGGLTRLIIFRGILIAISTLAVFISVQYFTGNLVLSRTAAFVTLVMAQLMHVFECKSEKRTILEIPIFNNIFLIFAVACSTAMILAVVYLPFLQPVFKTAALSINEWAFVLGFSSLGPMLSSIFRKR